jgi:hypothetical protein
MNNEDDDAVCGAALACLLVAGVSALVLYWEVNTILIWQSDPAHLLEQIWSLAMISSIALAWFTLLPLLGALASRRQHLTTVLGLFLLFLGGPNLLALDVFGVIVGALRFKDFCVKSDDCENDSFVLAMQVCSWVVLYCVACLCSYGLFFLLKRRWRRSRHQVYQSLAQDVCSVCKEMSSEGLVLECQHHFHSACLQGSSSCPVCVHEGAVELSSA